MIAPYYTIVYTYAERACFFPQYMARWGRDQQTYLPSFKNQTTTGAASFTIFVKGAGFV